MRTVLTGLILVAGMAWSFESRAQLQPPPPMYPPPAAAPAPNWGFPNAPPPSPPMQAATTQQLEQQSNSFRGLEIAWANVEAGGGYVGMPSKFGYGSTSGTGGPAFGLGVGGRFLTWTLGVRGRVMPMSKFTLVQAMLEAGYHLPVGAWDPYLNIRGGYVTALLKSPGDLNVGTSAAPVLVAPLDVPNPHGAESRDLDRRRLLPLGALLGRRGRELRCAVALPWRGLRVWRARRGRFDVRCRGRHRRLPTRWAPLRPLSYRALWRSLAVNMPARLPAAKLRA